MASTALRTSHTYRLQLTSALTQNPSAQIAGNLPRHTNSTTPHTLAAATLPHPFVVVPGPARHSQPRASQARRAMVPVTGRLKQQAILSVGWANCLSRSDNGIK